MRFSQYFLENYYYTPTKDEIRHFNQVRSGRKIDFSKDLLNQVFKKLSKITIQISDEKIRNKFAEVMFRNMGSLDNLILAVKKLNSVAINNSKKEEIENYLRSIENDL